MGFFDKIKEKVNTIKEENRNFGKTMKRINNRADYFGTVDKGKKESDFAFGSYISNENKKFVIYGSGQDDYVFTEVDIQSMSCDGEVGTVRNDSNSQALPKKIVRYHITFKDGKKAQCDIQVEPGNNLDQAKINLLDSFMKFANGKG